MMAMVHCRGCGETIHESATTCPKCGAPQGASAQTGSHTPLPEGVAGWSWGAFLCNWVWGIFNGTWISLLTLIPFVGWIMAFVLGFKGREWAWRNKRWQSVEHFQRVQRLWSVWSLSIVGVAFVIGVIGAIALPAYSEYHARASRAKTAVALQDQRQASQAKAANTEVKAARPGTEPAYAATATPVVTPLPTSATVAPRTALAAVEGSTSTSNDLGERAQKCDEALRCVEIMLEGAIPRRPDVLTVAAARLTTLNSLPAGDRKESRALNTQALALYGAKDYSAAADIFKQAAQINPRDAEIQANLGLALIRDGKSEEAIQALGASLQLDPRRSNAWAPLAEAMDKLQHPKATSAALLLVYEYSGNRQKTIDFFRSRTANEEITESMRTAYASALKTIEVGY